MRPCWLTPPQPEEFMPDDVLIHKAATVERCVARAREEYAYDPATFATDFTQVVLKRGCFFTVPMLHEFL